MKIPIYDVEKKIALGVSCNDNSEAELTRAIDPWVPYVDYIIAVEGRYRVPYSPAMMKAPIPPKFGENTSDILYRHYNTKIHYTEFYGTQNDKRQWYMNIAGQLNCDILIVMDTDDIIHPDYHDFDKLLKQLALLHEFLEGKPGVVDQLVWIPSEEDWPRQFNKVESNTWKEYHRIHLNPGKQRYALNHYVFALKDATDKQITGFTANRENVTKKNPYLLYPMATVDSVRITTDRKLRTNEQNDYGNSWTWQWMQEETYRSYLLELKVLGDLGDKNMKKIYNEQYRKPFTYYFDNNARPVMYTKEEQNLFNSLEL